MPSDSHRDIGYGSSREGPSENVLAVWAVLSQNYPNAYKGIDKTDPGGVWAANLDDLTSAQMTLGLKALALHDDRFMPNAPNCRRILLEAARVNHRALPGPDHKPVPRFERAMGILFVNYITTMGFKYHEHIPPEAGSACRDATRRLAERYEQAYDEEPSPGAWGALVRDLSGECLKEWREICGFKRTLTLGDLKRGQSSPSTQERRRARM